MNLLACVESVPPAIADDALLYCGLMLEQAALPVNWKRDLYFDKATSVLDPTAVSLGRRILSQIEESECFPIDQLDQKTLDAYTRQMSIAMHELFLRKDALPVVS